MYQIDIEFTTVVASEKDPDKVRFFQSQFGCDFMVSKVGDCQGEMARRVTSDGVTQSESDSLLPFCRMLDGGVPCTAVTPLSSSRKQNSGCVQRGVASTGVGFKETFGVIERQNPEVVLLECVKTLGETGDNDIPDSEYIVEQFAKHKYWASCVLVDAVETGSYAPRKRFYWPGLSQPDAKPVTVSHFFHKILNACKMEKPLPQDRSITNHGSWEPFTNRSH